MNNIEVVCSMPMSLLCKALIERKLHQEGNIFKLSQTVIKCIVSHICLYCLFCEHMYGYYHIFGVPLYYTLQL